MKKIIILLSLIIIAGCGSEPTTYDELITAGKKEFVSDNYVKARNYFTKALTQNQSSRDALYYIGMSYQREYRLDSAFYYLKRADLLNPKDREINMSLYHMALELKEYENAVKAINVLIETGDRADKYYKQLADLNLKIDHPYVAMLYARKLLETDTTNPANYLMLANIASVIDSVDYALEIIDQAIDKFGEEKQFIMNKAIYMSKRGQAAQSEKVIRDLLAENPDDDLIKLNLANVLTIQNDREKKREGYNILKEIRNSIGQVYNVDSIMTVLEVELNL